MMTVTTVTSSGRTQHQAVTSWLDALGKALRDADAQAVAKLFVAHGDWRDVLALTWSLHTFVGVEQIESAMAAALRHTTVVNVALEEAVPIRSVTRGGEQTVEAVFTLQTDLGNGRGVVRLADPVGEIPLARTLLTSLDELRGSEERVGPRRCTGTEHSTRFGGENWLDRRKAKARFVDCEPVVLVVGAGQAGLAVAARLTQLGVDTLVIDRERRIGDNWRNRYHSLVLHNEVWVNHLPYMPFPDTWPTYVPKDKLADWLQAYADSMEINYWTQTELVSGAYDSVARSWQVVVQGSDGQRTLRPRHIVMATGVSGIPRIPDIPGLYDFTGEVLHSSSFVDGHAYAGKSVMVIGAGNSAHDVAQEMYSCGAQVVMVQRSPTTVTSVGPSGSGRVYSLYSEGLPTDVCDLITISITAPTLTRSYQLMTEELRDHDKELLAGLTRAGFRWDYGEDSTGFQMKYLRRGGGYYLNVGCSDLIVDGTVGLMQFSDISHITSQGVELADGQVYPVDTIVLATGYHGQQELIAKLFGRDTAQRVGPIWGFDDGGELRNMWKPTPQPGLWFSAGSLAQCRIYSKYLALQIKACEEGLISAEPDPDVAGVRDRAVGRNVK